MFCAASDFLEKFHGHNYDLDVNKDTLYKSEAGRSNNSDMP